MSAAGPQRRVEAIVQQLAPQHTKANYADPTVRDELRGEEETKEED